MHMRKTGVFPAVLLAAVLAASSGFAADTATKAKPGEEFTVPVTVNSNPDQAVAAVLKVEYDHEVLELIPSDFVQNDTILLLDLNGIQPGEAGQISFRVQAEAKQGGQKVRFSAASARDWDEKDVSGPVIDGADVIVAKGKELPGDEYYANGIVKQKVEVDGVGNIQKVLYYNRFGEVTRIEEVEAWDREGNILQKTIYYPNKETSEHDTYSYTYDKWGNTLSEEVTRKEDGVYQRRYDYEYDEYDRRTKTTFYNEKGEIESYTADYIYDGDNHIIGSRQLQPDGQTSSYTRNIWKDGVRVESYKTDPNGNISSRDTYDPVFGDALFSETFNEKGERGTTQHIYYENSYETDWRRYGTGFRTVTLYSADERKIRTTSYRAKPDSDEWIEEYYTIYSTNEAGNTVAEQRNVDGSRSITERDSSGNSLKSTAYNENGSFYYAYTYEYDGSGQKIRSNRLNEDGTLESYTLYEYNSIGKESRTMSYESDGSFWYGYSYEYDEKGKTIRENKLEEDGTIKSYKLNEYDEKGNKTRSVEYGGSGTMRLIALTEYDEDGNRIRVTKYDAEGAYAGSTEYEYDKDGNRTRETRYNADTSCAGSTEYEYDKNGNKIRETKFDGDSKYAGSTEYEYDKNGVTTYCVSYSSDRTKSSETLYRTLEDGTRQSKQIWYNADGTIKDEIGWE